MKKFIAIILASIGLVYYGSTVYPHAISTTLYPNATLTPGKIDTTSADALKGIFTINCPVGKQTCTYSESHRDVSQSTKDKVCAEYPENCKGVHEIDHFCAVALGCSNDISNLWAQPEHVMVNGEDWGFHTKDRLESFLVLQVKAGNMTPSDAQQCLLKDWIACYKANIKQTFGSVVGASDTDDLIE